MCAASTSLASGAALREGRITRHRGALPSGKGVMLPPSCLHSKDKNVSPCIKGIGCTAGKILSDSLC